MGTIKKATAVVALGGITIYMAGLGGWPLIRWVGGGAWLGIRGTAAFFGPPAWILLKDIGTVAVGTGKLIVETPTAKAVGRTAVKGAGLAAAVGVGYTAGAVTGTLIVSKAEKEGIVYEGATEDVLEFYLGRAEGEYWGDYDWQGQPTTDDPGRPGYFNIPGNLGIIADHVKHGHYFGH